MIRESCWTGGSVRVDVLGDRAGISTAVLLTCAGRSLLIDCGDGAVVELAQRGISPSAVVGVALTHDHGDHTGGLYALLWGLRALGRNEDLPVLRPVQSFVADALIETFRVALGDRARMGIVDRRLEPGVTIDCGPFALSPFPVRHRAFSSDPEGLLMEAYGFRIEVDGIRIVLTGDTGPHEGLAQEVAGADLAVIEATFPNGGRAFPADLHLTLAQAEDLAHLAKASLLYHRRPDPPE